MRRSARTDLCGGRSAMLVPTATAKRIGLRTPPAFWLTRATEMFAKWPILAEKSLSHAGSALYKSRRAVISRGTSLSFASDSISLLSQILRGNLPPNFGFQVNCWTAPCGMYRFVVSWISNGPEQ
jgi:hypothetical protein